MADWIKHDGYRSMICEHHQDIVTCDRCQILKDGSIVVDDSSVWQKVRNPVGYLKMRRQIKKFAKYLEKEQGL